MDITVVYAIILCGFLLTLLLVNLFPAAISPTFSTPLYLKQALRYLRYPYIVHRHRFLGPWTLADVLLQVIYIAGTSFCLAFRVSDIAKAGARAGNLSLINMAPLFLGPHLGSLADLLGISLSTFRSMHRSTGVMSCSLVLFHVLAVFVSDTVFSVRGIANLSAIISGASLVLITVASWSQFPLRQWSYEIFLRLHYVLAAVVAISAVLHAPSTLFPRIYFYIYLGIFTATSAYEGWLLLLRNGVIARSKGRKLPRVGEVFKYPDTNDNGPVQLTIVLQEALKIEAGQYVNIYIPSVGLRSFISIQTHPFVVASWTGKKQTKLELMIEPRRGWTRTLKNRATSASGESGGLGRVLFTGPHGAIIPVGSYEYILMVASGYGIVAHLPLLERLVQGTLAREVRARRIRLVWECEDIELYNAIFPLFNWHLGEDRRLKNKSALVITVHTTEMPPEPLSNRASISRHLLSSRNVLDNEIAELEKEKAQADEAERKLKVTRAKEVERGRRRVILGNPEDEVFHEPDALPVYSSTPRMLITVSASKKIRDELRSALRLSLKKEITLRELDYQPSS